MTLYYFRISCCVCGSTNLCFNMLARIILVSVTGMLEYRFVMSNEARFLKILEQVLSVFYAESIGSGSMWMIVRVNSLDRLYAGALRQFTTGRIGWYGLCIFISPLKEGAEGFMLMYFHLLSLGIRVLLSCIVFLIWVCNVLVGSVAAMWKILSNRNFLSRFQTECGKYDYRVSLICLCYHSIVFL